MTPIILHLHTRMCANPHLAVAVNPAHIVTVQTEPEYTRIELVNGHALHITEDIDKVLREIHYADVANASLLERN